MFTQSEKLLDLSFNILICKSAFSLQKRGCPLFAGPGVVASWENLMDGLKLLDAFQPLEDRCVDDLLRQAGNLCDH